MKRTRVRSHGRCVTPDCWELATGPAGFCRACRASWSRLIYKTVDEIAFYLRKATRMTGRGKRMVRQKTLRKAKAS